MPASTPETLLVVHWMPVAYGGGIVYIDTWGTLYDVRPGRVAVPDWRAHA